MKSKELAQEIITRLNRLIEVEDEDIKDDIFRLMKNKIQCYSTIEDHPYITVDSKMDSVCTNHYFLGTLGILNGILESTDFKIAMVTNSSGSDLLRFELIESKEI